MPLYLAALRFPEEPLPHYWEHYAPDLLASHILSQQQASSIGAQIHDIRQLSPALVRMRAYCDRKDGAPRPAYCNDPEYRQAYLNEVLAAISRRGLSREEAALLLPH
ncbi:MAG TPA: hypothetical protein V6D06_14750 [Trichocoleus sp.]